MDPVIPFGTVRVIVKEANSKSRLIENILSVLFEIKWNFDSNKKKSEDKRAFRSFSKVIVLSYLCEM